MMNRLLSMIVCGSILFTTSIFAVEWTKDSAPFAFSCACDGVTNTLQLKQSVSLSYSRLTGKNQILFKYNLPSDRLAVLNIYSINGVQLASFPLSKNSTSVVWKSSAKQASGTYTAVLKSDIGQKTMRFVVAN